VIATVSHALPLMMIFAPPLLVGQTASWSRTAGNLFAAMSSLSRANPRALAPSDGHTNSTIQACPWYIRACTSSLWSQINLVSKALRQQCLAFLGRMFFISVLVTLIPLTKPSRELKLSLGGATVLYGGF